MKLAQVSTNAKATTLSRTPAPTVPNHNTNANHRAMGNSKKANTKNDESCPSCDLTGFEVTRWMY